MVSDSDRPVATLPVKHDQCSHETQSSSEGERCGDNESRSEEGPGLILGGS